MQGKVSGEPRFALSQPLNGGVGPSRKRKLRDSQEGTEVREARFIVLGYTNKVPTMAGCTRCPCKFFVPSKMAKDEDIASRYLLEKFDRHKCDGLLNAQLSDMRDLWRRSA